MNSRRRFAIATLGCKVNQCDSEIMREALEKRGFREVPFSRSADIYVINTCTVTGRADYQSRQLMRRVHRLNPKARVIATGCYAEVFPRAVGAVDGVSVVLGNEGKRNIASVVSRLMGHDRPSVWIPPIPDGPLEDFHIAGHAQRCRAFLKIQDGCDAACSYCIIPRARGRSRSLPRQNVRDHLARLRARGYQEVVLTGVHLGSYGLDLSPPTSLAELIEWLEGYPDLPNRLRLSSIEPSDFTEALVSVLGRGSRVCPHVHIPLQSGDNEILAHMNRGYTRERFQGLIQSILDRLPSASIGLDVIGGFPGETEIHFQNTVDLIERLPIAYLHVFPFSPRPGTVAYDMPQRVRGDEIHRRCMILRALGHRKKIAYYSGFLHRRVKVLTEKTTMDETGRWKGVSRNYIPIWIKPEGKPLAQEIEVELTHVVGERVFGRRV